MKIAVTGYYGTGSSAIIDLLESYDNVDISIDDRYEHFIFMNKGALFDLESRLFSDNSNYLIRDIAINDFIIEMKRQYENDFGWYGSLKKLYGDRFISSVKEFVDTISYESDKGQFAHSLGVKYTLWKVILQLGAKILKGAKIHKWGRVFEHDKNSSRYLKVNHEEFLVAARKFVNDYLDMTKSSKDITIYDHILFPEQVGVVDKFFDDDFKVIVIDRDPRDIFFSGKYVWSTVAMGSQRMPYSFDVKMFCKEWEIVHKEPVKNKNVLYVSFDDLIYNFENVKKKVLDFVGIEDDLKGKECKLDPSKSIKNTQVPRLFKEHSDEKEYIEEHLGKYCYKYPYEIDAKLDEIFD